jgi:hypothetical protein
MPMREWLLSYTNSTIFQIYHGENKLILQWNDDEVLKMCVISSVNYKMYHHYSVTSDLFLIFWMSSLTVYYIDWHWDVTQWNDFFYFTKWISLFLSFSEILFFLSFSEILVFLSLSEILVFLSLSKILVFLPLSEISVFLPLSKICVFLSFVNLSI